MAASNSIFTKERRTCEVDIMNLSINDILQRWKNQINVPASTTT